MTPKSKNKTVCLVYGVADKRIHAVYHHDNENYNGVKVRPGELKMVIPKSRYMQFTSATLKSLIPV